MKYKLSANTARGVDGLFDFCKSAGVEFNQYKIDGTDYRSYYTWIDSEIMMLIKLKFPQLMFIDIPDEEGT